MWMLIALALAAPGKGRSRDTSEVRVRLNGDTDVLHVHNEKAYPVTFTVELGRGDNVDVKPRRGKQQILKAGELIPLPVGSVPFESTMRPKRLPCSAATRRPMSEPQSWHTKVTSSKSSSSMNSVIHAT